jgi:hypothetical protein
VLVTKQSFVRFTTVIPTVVFLLPSQRIFFDNPFQSVTMRQISAKTKPRLDPWTGTHRLSINSECPMDIKEVKNEYLELRMRALRSLMIAAIIASIYVWMLMHCGAVPFGVLCAVTFIGLPVFVCFFIYGFLDLVSSFGDPLSR